MYEGVEKGVVIAELQKIIDLINESEMIAFGKFRIVNDYADIPDGLWTRSQPTGWRNVVIQIKLLSKQEEKT